MEHKRANDEINRVGLAGGTITVDMLTARNALENKRNGFETTYNKATAAQTKCLRELQAATEARNLKTVEAQGLRNAIKREEEKKRIEKEQEQAREKKRIEEKQRQEALEKKRIEEKQARKL